MKLITRGLIEDAIPTFLGRSRPKCRFILKRIPTSWVGSRVEIKELAPEEYEPIVDSLISLGQNEIDHSNHELFLCDNPNLLYFCFESWKWAVIKRV